MAGMTSTAVSGRRAKACIFCGALPLTQEHIFPRWLTKILTAAVVGAVTSERTNSSAAGATQQHWPATDVASYTVRVVCASCNNGWMSHVEGQAQAVLASMVAGEATTLSQAAQLDLATWTAMKGYVVEYALGDVIVATQQQRRSLMESKFPQGAVPVRIGAVERSGVPNSVTRIVYNVGREGSEQGFAACTTFGLGCAVLQVRHGLGITMDWTATSVPGTDQLPVNPPCPGDIHWPPTVTLNASSLMEWERPIPVSDPAKTTASSNGGK
jgi:hypothetical protein